MDGCSTCEAVCAPLGCAGASAARRRGSLNREISPGEIPGSFTMGVLAWILIGLIAGWLAAKITNAPRGLLRNLIVGLIGSLFGGFLFTKLGVSVVLDFWGEVLTDTIGAVVFMEVLQAIWRCLCVSL